jgi:glycosyltransferase involved in cell wall biosynthesis
MPTFSICIPTRERDVTLRSTIETVLAVRHPDFEIIVQDNFSSPATAEVVKSFDDPRLRYFRSERRLAMHDNWEAALEKATGNYVIFVGDDDAVMPDCFERAEPLLKSFDPDVLAWPGHVYYWPDCPDPVRRNLLIADIRNGPIWCEGFADDPFGANISYRFVDRPPGTIVFDGRSVAKGWYAWQGARPYAPIYHGIVCRRVIDRVRARCGRYFLDPTVDFASIAVNAYFSETILFYSRALSMSGYSGRSNGGALGNAETLENSLAVFLAEAGVTIDDIFPGNVSSVMWVPSLLFGCFENVRRKAFPDDNEIPRGMTEFIRHAAAEVGSQPAEHRTRCREWVIALADQHGVSKSELKFTESTPFVRPRGVQNDPAGRAFYINVDGDSAGLHTIADAVRLASSFTLQGDYLIVAPLPKTADNNVTASIGADFANIYRRMFDMPIGGIKVRGAPLTFRRLLRAAARRIQLG